MTSAYWTGCADTKLKVLARQSRPSPSMGKRSAKTRTATPHFAFGQTWTWQCRCTRTATPAFIPGCCHTRRAQPGRISSVLRQKTSGRISLAWRTPSGIRSFPATAFTFSDVAGVARTSPGAATQRTTIRGDTNSSTNGPSSFFFYVDELHEKDREQNLKPDDGYLVPEAWIKDYFVKDPWCRWPASPLDASSGQPTTRRTQPRTHVQSFRNERC